MRRLHAALAASLFVALLVLAGCGSSTSSTNTTSTATTVSSTTGTTTSSTPVTITLWHGYTGAEATTLTDLVTKFQQANPNITVNVLAVPFAQLQNKYQTAAASGGGPDVMIAPPDWLGGYVSAHLIQSLDTSIDPTLKSNLIPSALNALTISGSLYAVPLDIKSVALYYNTKLVSTPPTDTAGMISTAASVASSHSGDTGLVFNDGFYQSAGYLYAEGAQLMDSSNNATVNTPQMAAYLKFMAGLTADHGVLVKNDNTDSTLFKEGKAGMIIDGPWDAGNFETALGKGNVAVAPLPTLTATGKAPTPFIGVENMVINAASSSDKQAAALTFAEYMAGTSAQTEMFQQAGHVPVNTTVDTSGDPVTAGFVKQAQTAVPLPVVPQMGAFWAPMQDAITKAVSGQSASAALSAAQTQIQAKIQQINTSNG